MRVGYVRCSTIEQNEARQLKMMEEQKAEKLFIDKASGKIYRPPRIQGNDGLCPGGRHGYRGELPYRPHPRPPFHRGELKKKQVEFISLKENIDTTTPQGRFMLTVFGALAELETGEHPGAAAGGYRDSQERGQVQGAETFGGGRSPIQRRLQALEGRGNNGHRRHAGGGLEAQYLLSQIKPMGQCRPSKEIPFV